MTGILILGGVMRLGSWRRNGQTGTKSVLAATTTVSSPGQSWHQQLQLPATMVAAESSTQSKICLETPASCNMYFHLMFPGYIQDRAFFYWKAPKCNNEKQVLLDRFCSASFKGCKYQRLFPLNLNAILISHAGRALGHRWQSGRTDPCLQVMAACTRSWAHPAALFAAPAGETAEMLGHTNVFLFLFFFFSLFFC